MITGLDTETAKRIIKKLKAGTSPFDCVEYLNVGNERWYEAAAELFDDIKNDNDSIVRLVNGYYGDGKTHFLGMLRCIAKRKDWFVSYVTAEKTPLNKFDQVYSEIVKNITLPPNIKILPWLSSQDTSGARALLYALFSKLYIESNRPGDKEGLKKQRVLDTLRFKTNEFAVNYGIDEIMASAIRGSTECIIRSDYTQIQQIVSWLEGGDNKIPELGITRKIDQKFARDAMKGISIIAKHGGASGILVLLDEAERIMEQTRSIRNKSYGVLRDLLDNADSQGGMKSCVIYVAATPDMFTSEKGFAEYDALRSRLANAKRYAISNFIDWRSVIVDLTKTPLPHNMFIQLSKRILNVHAIARNWTPEKYFTDDLIRDLVMQIENDSFHVSKPRMLASSLAILLETAEQNREGDLSRLLNETINYAKMNLSKQLDSKVWE